MAANPSAAPQRTQPLGSSIPNANGAGFTWHRWTEGFVAFSLALLVLLVFHDVRHNAFVNYDDNVYVTDNLHTQAGITAESVRWALTSFDFNWHPITWLSHMLDVQLFGLQPGLHHLTSVALHLLNTLLLFAFLANTTQQPLPSALVAALWAVHPLRVEPVCWIAARKDLLSAFFWLLGMGSYRRYVARPSPVRMGRVSLWMALGLMSKGTLVTFPLALLLLDYWPLQRASTESRVDLRTWASLFLEKWPLWLLALTGSVVQIVAQRRAHALISVDVVGLDRRLANFPISYWEYLQKSIWPTGLAVPYPLDPAMPAAIQIAGACLVLLVATAVVFRHRLGRPYLLSGWLWFLANLVPVSGLAAQIGHQAMADRYMYLPSIGLFWMIAFGLQAVRPRLLPLLLVPVLASAYLASRQVLVWRDSRSLFEHALRHTQDNFIAENNLATALMDAGEPEPAALHLAESLRINPGYAQAHNNRGAAMSNLGRLAEAELSFREAIRLQPDYDSARCNLALTLLNLGRTSEAVTAYSEAVRRTPDSARARFELAQALEKGGDLSQARTTYAAALAINDRDGRYHFRLGQLCQRLSDLPCARAEYEEASKRGDRRGADGLALLNRTTPRN